jgi:long-chain fatty acid transport protein
MKEFNKWFTMLGVAAAMFVAGSAHATNGYFTHGIGTKNKSMAGAGTAMPEDAIDIANNPAAATVVGDNMVIGAAVFSPLRSYKSSDSVANGHGGAFAIGPNDLDSDSEYFVIPHIARTWQLKNDSAWGFAFYGRGGMNTDWKGGTATFDPDGFGPAPPTTFPGTFGAGDAGVDLSQALLDITWAKKVNDRLSLGVAAVFAFQVFEATGVQSFAPFTETFATAIVTSGMPVPVNNLSNNGHDFSYGAGIKFGLHSAVSDKVSVGLSYQSKLSMSEFDDYADLFAEDGGFDIPADLKFGLTIQANPNVALSFDITHTWFSDVDSVGNPIANLFGCPTAGADGMDLTTCLGGNNGGGFGWDDMTTYKFGIAWTSGNDWTWRAGYSHGDQPIPDSEVTFNILAPAVIEDHIAFGFTKKTASDNEWNVSLMYAFENDITGVQTFDPTQTVTLEMYQWEAEVSYVWRY